MELADYDREKRRRALKTFLSTCFRQGWQTPGVICRIAWFQGLSLFRMCKPDGFCGNIRDVLASCQAQPVIKEKGVMQMELTSTTTWSGTRIGRRTYRKCLPYLFSALLSAFPLPSLAAMVYGSVTDCDGTIDFWKDNIRMAVVSVQNRTYQVVLPPGTYRAICTSTNRSLIIRSDPSPVRQNLSFSN